MRLSTLIWSLLLIVAGVLVLTLDLGFANGPRLGMGVFMITTGVLMFMLANAAWMIRKTTSPEDYEGTCPVGRSCPQCGAFNLNPRVDCRVCEAELAGTPIVERAQ